MGHGPEGEDGAPIPPRLPADWSARQELAAYLLAATVYILLGFLAKGVFAWWVYSTAFLIAAVWGVPALWRRLG